MLGFEWPACDNCQFTIDGGCTLAQTRLQAWKRTKPADLKRYGCCGYWRSNAGETRRDRCAAVNRALWGTRPPVADSALPATTKEVP